jgi:acetyl esterase/lipase
MPRLIPLFLIPLALWGVTREEVVYRETPQGKLSMTVFYPAGWKPQDQRPGLVLFFGGGFVNGDPKQFYSKAGYLASRGMVVASAQYRIKSKHQTGVPEALEDCQAAFAWLRDHAREQGIDPAKLSAGGGSAGGACALSIAKAGMRPASFILYNPGGLKDLTPSADFPPSVMFFGSSDPSYTEAQAFQKRAPKGRVELFVAKGQPHGFFNDRGDGTWHASTAYLSDLFLESQGHVTGKPTIAIPAGSKAILFAEREMLPSPPGVQQPVPPGVAAHLDLEYQPGLKLDVLVPAGPPKPLVVWIHGGGWTNGNKEGGPARRLLRHGFAVASIRYRLSQQAPMPAQIDDCLAAIRYLRREAARLGYDGTRIGVWGSSAGGHLAALTGTKGEGDSKVQAVVDFYGPSDLRRMSMWPSTIVHDSPASPESRLIGGPVQQNPEAADAANPVKYVDAGDPPFLILHGDADPLVPLEQSELIAAALKAAKVPAELVVIHKAGHGGPGFDSPENQEKIRTFFAKHLLH